MPFRPISPDNAISLLIPKYRQKVVDKPKDIFSRSKGKSPRAKTLRRQENQFLF
jgi:hypothetical protein